jgi:hypothetical protein
VKKLIFIFIILSILTPLLSAESEPTSSEIIAWLQTDDKSSQYTDFITAITERINQIESKSLPLSLIFEKVKEGVSKRVSGQKLIAALDDLTACMIDASGLYEKARARYAETKLPPRNRFIRNTSIFLLGGLDSETVVFPLLVSSIEAHDNPDRFIAVCSMLLEIRSLQINDQQALQSLGEVLIESRLPPASYGSISSIFMKARARGMGASEALSMITGIIAKGGGIIQLDQEMQRRLRNR